MALQSNVRTAWTYTTDAPAEDFVISAKKVIMDTAGNDAKLGGAAADETMDAIPNGFKPRRVKCVDADENAVWIICYTTAATLWTTPGTAIQWNYHGVDTAFKSTRFKRAEKRERVGKNPAASA
jgi:hypothetical protein